MAIHLERLEISAEDEQKREREDRRTHESQVRNLSTHDSFDDLCPLRGQVVEEDNMCVVCLDAPQTSGFLHGTTYDPVVCMLSFRHHCSCALSSHRCVYEPCALKISQRARPRSPVCRAVVRHTIFKMY